MLGEEARCLRTHETFEEVSLDGNAVMLHTREWQNSHMLSSIFALLIGCSTVHEMIR